MNSKMVPSSAFCVLFHQTLLVCLLFTIRGIWSREEKDTRVPTEPLIILFGAEGVFVV